MDQGLSFDTNLNILSQNEDFDGFRLLSYSTYEPILHAPIYIAPKIRSAVIIRTHGLIYHFNEWYTVVQFYQMEGYCLPQNRYVYGNKRLTGNI